MSALWGVKWKVWSTIGPPRIVAHPQNEVGTLFDFVIPKEILGDVAYESTRYLLHNGSDEERDRMEKWAKEVYDHCVTRRQYTEQQQAQAEIRAGLKAKAH